MCRDRWAGFIGSHLVKRLIGEGVRLRVIDNLTTGTMDNLEDVLDSKLLEFVQGDIRDSDCLCQVFHGSHAVFHQAALTSVPASVDDPISTHEVNITGTLNVLSIAEECSVHRVVLASLSVVCGSSTELPSSEVKCPHPELPYAICKYMGEQYTRFFSRYKSVETVCLRYFNVHGPM